MDEGHFPGFEGCDTSASPSSFLLAVHDDDVDVTPLLSLQNDTRGSSGEGEDCDCVDRGVTHAHLHDDAQSDDHEDGLVNTLEAIFGHMSQHEDAGYDDDEVEVSVVVGVSAVVGVGVNGQGVGLCICRGVGLVVAFPPLTSLDS